jgi:nucleoid-associated protein YejK
MMPKHAPTQVTDITNKTSVTSIKASRNSHNQQQWEKGQAGRKICDFGMLTLFITADYHYNPRLWHLISQVMLRGLKEHFTG